ncbi:MAG: SpoIIE family protein phosphatase [Bernardetiaceae bacterium]|nr:SpoIIE family protein phosphatase [Bernardetiaceae bacterium]
MMTQEDLSVLRLIKNLLEKDEQIQGASPPNLPSQESTNANTYMEQLKRKVNVLQEQISSQMQMIQMTMEYMEREEANKADLIPRAEPEQAGNISLYTQSIKQKMLDYKESLSDVLPHSFVMAHEIKDNIAGFLAIKVRNKLFYLVSVQNKLKGVNSTLVMLLVHRILEELLEDHRIQDVANIVAHVDKSINDIFATDETKRETPVSIGICAIDWLNATLSFSGVQTTLFVLDSGKIEEVKTTQTPLGSLQKQDTPIQKQHIALKKGMFFYLADAQMTEGFTDAAQEAENKMAECKKLMQEQQGKPAHDMRADFQRLFTNWESQSQNKCNTFITGFGI